MFGLSLAFAAGYALCIFAPPDKLVEWIRKLVNSFRKDDA